MEKHPNHKALASHILNKFYYNDLPSLGSLNKTYHLEMMKLFLFLSVIMLVFASKPASSQYHSSIFLPNTADLSSQSNDYFNNQAFGLINLLNTNLNNNTLQLQRIPNDFRPFDNSDRGLINSDNEILGVKFTSTPGKKVNN